MKMKSFLLAAIGSAALFSQGANAAENNPADLNDLQIAHVAYIADNIDIRYAHLALAISKNEAVRNFAQTMISDHNAVNGQALALLQKLNVQPQDNFLSQFLNQRADKIVADMSKLEGAAFDNAYAANELAYHKEVNALVGGTFIPNIDNAEVKALFEAGLEIFKAHEAHAENMVASLN